jgi:DNA-binding MarR family transcriptional regulator
MSIQRVSGELMLGSRLKRLGERLFSEVGRVYRNLAIPFEPAWFPIFFLLDRDGSLSVTTLAREMGVSDPAASQLVRQIQQRGLVEIQPGERDRRIKMMILSPSGRKLLKQVKPVWLALQQTLNEMVPEDNMQHLLTALTSLEDVLGQELLTGLVQHTLAAVPLTQFTYPRSKS